MLSLPMALPSCLQARNAGRGQVLKQFSVAKKVNDFLASRFEETSTAYAHHQKMKAWLGRMETQLSSAMPSAPPPAALPK